MDMKASDNYSHAKSMSSSGLGMRLSDNEVM